MWTLKTLHIFSVNTLFTWVWTILVHRFWRSSFANLHRSPVTREPASFTRLNCLSFTDSWNCLAYWFRVPLSFTDPRPLLDSRYKCRCILLADDENKKTTNTTQFLSNSNYSDKDITGIYWAYRKVIVFQWNPRFLRLLMFTFPSFCNYSWRSRALMWPVKYDLWLVKNDLW